MRRSIFLLLSILLLSGTAALPTQAQGNCTQWYTVQPGNTLAGIARYFGTSVAYLASINGISNPNHIYWGMTICVRTSNPPPPQPTYYVVQPGDWLAKIAQRFHVSLYALIQANPRMNPNLIYPGEVLVIPSAGGYYQPYGAQTYNQSNQPYNPYPPPANNQPYNPYPPPMNNQPPPVYGGGSTYPPPPMMTPEVGG